MIQLILTSSLSDTLAYALIAVAVLITFRVLFFPDLTIDGSFVTGGSITATMLESGWDPYLATLAAIFGGAVCGLITGLINTKLKISALLAGLLMAVGLYSINILIMGRPNIPLLRLDTIFDKVESLTGIPSNNAILVIGVLALITLVLVLLLNWFLRTEIGLALRATGDNEQMVRSLGSDTDKNILIGVAMANGLVALSGSLVAQRQEFCDVNMGVGIMVIGIAAVIIGEGLVRPRGVAAMLFAPILGTFVYRLFIVIALRIGLPPANLKLITALLIIFVLGLPTIKKMVRREWMPPAPKL